jgi:hypothetical protein
MHARAMGVLAGQQQKKQKNKTCPKYESGRFRRKNKPEYFMRFEASRDVLPKADTPTLQIGELALLGVCVV